MSLDRLFRPRSIAILGASEDFAKINGRPLKFLLEKGYLGRIFPVNPKYQQLAGLACYPSLLDIPEPVDLAIIAVPASAVEDAVGQCVRKQVGGTVVFSSGFSEMGAEGRRLEARVARVARGGGVRLLGPNTLGFMNNFERVMATFSQAGEGETAAGPVAFVTQSGAFGTALFALARQRGLPFGYFINTGNEADVDFADVLDWVIDDPNVRVVAGYIEGLRDGRRLLAAGARALESGKPVVITKVGRSSAGARAALSHTGALAGSDRVYADLTQQKGLIRAMNEEALLDLVDAFSLTPLPAGRRLAVVTHSGGAGVLMADRAEEIGLLVPELGDETTARLRKVIPAFGAVKNPVDITAQFIADPSLLTSSLSIVLEDPEIDAAIFYLGLMDRVADRVVANLREVQRSTTKPLLVAWVAAPAAGASALRETAIPMLPTASRAVDAVHGLVSFADARRLHEADRASAPGAAGTAAPAAAEALARARAEGRRVLGSIEAYELLGRYGVRSPRVRLARTPSEAASAVGEVGIAALKVESSAILHKTESGGIRLGIHDADAARRAFDEIVAAARVHAPSAAIEGVLIQEMVGGGTEVVIGVQQDPQFGPVVMVGLGGILVEVLEDVAFGAAPLSRREAEAMVGRLRGARILRGVRGRPPADVDALIDVLVGISRLAADSAGTIAELDVNPLVVMPAGQGALALDALVVLSAVDQDQA